MNIRKAWNRLWGIKKDPIKEEIRVKQEEILKEARRTEPPSMEEVAERRRNKQQAEKGREGLINAFYGTLVDRTEYNELNRHKKRHAHDGWRHGKSHPFRFRGATYDVQKRSDDSLELFQTPMAKFDELEKE
jgi:hypothetical protein